MCDLTLGWNTLGVTVGRFCGFGLFLDGGVVCPKRTDLSAELELDEVLTMSVVITIAVPDGDLNDTLRNDLSDAL